jgi:hypothetical protein
LAFRADIAAGTNNGAGGINITTDAAPGPRLQASNYFVQV